MSIAGALAAAIPGYVFDELVVADERVVEIRGHDQEGPIGAVLHFLQVF